MINYTVTLGELAQIAFTVLGVAFVAGQFWSWKQDFDTRLDDIANELKETRKLAVVVARQDERIRFLNKERDNHE